MISGRHSFVDLESEVCGDGHGSENVTLMSKRERRDIESWDEERNADIEWDTGISGWVIIINISFLGTLSISVSVMGHCLMEQIYECQENARIGGRNQVRVVHEWESRT